MTLATIAEDALRIIGERDRALAKAAVPVDRVPLAEPRWFAVVTGPRQEATAATSLRQAGYHAVFPFDRYRVRRRRPGTKVYVVSEVDRPHFPRYVFVALRYVNEPIGPINDTKGVSRLVCRRLSGEPLQIPTAVMDKLLGGRMVAFDDEAGSILMTETVCVGDRDLQLFINGLGKRQIRVLSIAA